jgi:hypothetical protein
MAALLLVAAASPALEIVALNTAQYADQLHTYENQIAELPTHPQNALALRDSLPDKLIVQSTRGKTTVDVTFLRDALNRYLTANAEARPNILAHARTRLEAMRTEAALYEQPDGADEATRKRLDEILSAREFDRLHGPTPVELLKERIQAWIAKMLKKLSPKMPDSESAGQLFVWCMIALSAAVAAVWFYRVSRQNIGTGQREILPFMPSSRSWREWLADARARAARGEWRDAVHFGFWAAVSRLESEGVWTPDKTRTPREYVNAIPGFHLSKATFAALTHRFEASWYGSRPTTENDFAQFAADLEKLGCH